jgi:hypothetical protein
VATPGWRAHFRYSPDDFRIESAFSGAPPIRRGRFFVAVVVNPIAPGIVFPPVRRVSPALFALLLALPAAAAPVTLTIPAAASLHGSHGTFFHSDVWIMNRSFLAPAAVVATYRCFNGESCGRATATLDVAPRQSLEIPDIVAGLFEAPESGGAIELSWDEGQGPVSASSRLYTPEEPGPTFGQLVPALPADAARSRTLFLGVAGGGGPTDGGFRANAGAYNPNSTPVDVTFALYGGDGAPLGTPLTRTWQPHEAFQFNDIFSVLGVAAATTNADLVVSTGGTSIFAYATLIDNQSGDSIFLAPSADEAPVNVQTITIDVKAWDFDPGGPVSPPLVLKVGVTYRLVFHDIDPPGTPTARHGFSGVPELGLPAGSNIMSGEDFVIPSFTPQPFQRGTYPFACTQENPPCGGDLESHLSMRGTLIVE